MIKSVDPTQNERTAAHPGDGILPRADVVMDTAFSVAATPAVVWPWLVQLGKRRAGWYLPHSVERLVPRRRRALRTVDARWQGLRVGDVIPDYGGRDATFRVAELSPGRHIVYTSQRGSVSLTWSISLLPETGPDEQVWCRVLLRLRLTPVRRRYLAHSLGAAFDQLTVAGMAAGLRERLRP